MNAVQELKKAELAKRISKIKELPADYKNLIAEALPEFEEKKKFIKLQNVRLNISSDEEITGILELMSKRYIDFKAQLFAELQEYKATRKQQIKEETGLLNLV